MVYFDYAKRRDNDVVKLWMVIDCVLALVVTEDW